MEDKEIVLKEFGLSKNEAKAYLALLKLGSASVGDITKSSGIHRRNVYDALERLAEKGMVGSAVKNNIKIFEAANPQQLLNTIENEIREIKEKEKRMKSVLPELLLIKELGAEAQDVKIYRGKESRRVIFEDILNDRPKENLVLGAHSPSKLSKKYLDGWHKRRIKAGIKDRLIYCRPEPYAKYLARMSLTEVRFLPKKIRTTTAMNIHGDKIAMLLWSNGQPISIVINNKNVADDFKSYFDFLWKISEKCVA